MSENKTKAVEEQQTAPAPRAQGENLSKPVSVSLEDAVEFEGQTYTELNLRKMIVRDRFALKAYDNDPEEMACQAYALLAGVPIEVIHALSIDDADKVTEVAAPLMGKQSFEMMKKMQAAMDTVPN